MARIKFGFPGIYNASPITLADGEGCAPGVTSSGYLIVQNPDGTNVGASTIDGATFTQGTTTGNLAFGTYQSSPQTIVSGKSAAIAIDVNRNVMVTLGTALTKAIDGITSRPEGTTYTDITASTSAIRTGTGILVGMYVNSTTGGTIKIYDNTAQSGTVINNTITPAIGFHNLGNAAFGTGLSVTIANTLDVTLYYIPTP